ncbi:MAG: glycosyltransferase family 2 protein [Endomicrobiaceae bacterium]|nr:glycosyltransferase family 2 protein [Endomicrobiaceae bacterium]
MNKNKVFISVVMPVYNERLLIDSAITETIEALSKDFERYELVIVDDGSTDDTYNLILNHADKNNNIIVIRHDRNENLGKSLHDGFLKASGEYIIFNSADLPLVSDDIKKMLEQQFPFDLLNIERIKYSGASMWRKIVSFCNKFLLHILFPANTKDFKDMNFTIILKKEILRDILPKAKSPGFFMPEMILKAKNKKLNIKNMQINYQPRHKGKSHFGKIKDIIWSLYDMMRFRLNF